ncbi:MAG: hypothetical protein CMN31_13285 [Sandaracinus sp.]|nr:hypothetical protein [Sandaracinus sp.]
MRYRPSRSTTAATTRMVLRGWSDTAPGVYTISRPPFSRAGPSNAMRILYLGVPLGARVLHDAGHPPVAAGFAPLDLPGRRWARRALRGALLLGSPRLGDRAVQHALASTRPDVVLSFFWPRRIPEPVLALAPAYGTHPSLLPRWRGPDPYYWAIREGDVETGVTLHRLEARYDTGPVVAQRRLPVGAEDTAWSLARKLDRPALALLVELVDRLAGRDVPSVTPQNHGCATEAPFPTPEQLALDWTRPAEVIARHVRAAAPEPGATALLGETEVEILAVAPTDARPPPGLRPAEAWRSEAGWAVRCGRGAVRLLALRRADDGEPVTPDALFADRA